MLLLASRSAARRAMLEAAGVPFRPADSDYDEGAAKTGLRGLDAAALARVLAEGKAKGVWSAGADPVLGCDQTLERDDGSTFGKPESRDECFAQLRALSGRTHRLHSAAVIVERGRIIWETVESVKLTMRPVSDAYLHGYLDREYESVRWGVGGYRIEGEGVQLFDRIEGSHFAILGLPLLPLLHFLRSRDYLSS